MNVFKLLPILLGVAFGYDCSGLMPDWVKRENRKSKRQVVTRLLPKSDNMAPLMKAVYENDIHHAHELIKSGARVKQEVEGYSQTPLMVAARFGNIDMMKVLIDAGADVNAVSFCDQPHAGYPVLQYAIDSGNIEAVSILIKAGANSNDYVENGIRDARKYARVRNVPLLTSAIKSNVPMDIILELIAGGADVNKRDMFGGWTPLMVASHLGYTDTVYFLLQAGADRTLKNVNDKECSCNKGFWHKITGLLGCGRTSKDSHDNGCPYHKDGRTALDYAQETKNDDIIRLLRK